MSNFFYQPDLEAILDAKVQALNTVQVLRGWTAVTHLEDEGGVTVKLQSAADNRRTVTARDVVGADGANSLVICLPNPVAAAQRDQTMQADLAVGVEQPPRPLPHLGPGLHRDNAGGGALHPGRGQRRHAAGAVR